MGLKKRTKVSAEFSMSSLTDIIFLLLIFFMLTSSMIQVNYQLPESDSRTVAQTDDIAVQLYKDGTLKFNGKKSSWKLLEKRIAVEVRGAGNKQNATVAIISETGVPWDRIHRVMKIAAGLKLKAVIATQPHD